MNIEIEQLTLPELKKLLPLNYSGEIKYSYYIHPVEELHLLNTLLCFRKYPSKCFPIYFFLDISNFIEPFTIECEKHGLTFEEFGEFRKSKFVRLSIEDEVALTAIFPTIKSILIAEDFVMWSFDEKSLKWRDEVSLQSNFFRYPPITIQFEKRITIFVPIECGSSFILFSNEDQFDSTQEMEHHLKSSNTSIKVN